MPYSEAFGFVTNLEDESENNVIDAVIAHEMAHQWWAHQLVGADMQGSTFLSEAFSEYSSLMTMKSITPNPMKMREFLKYDHNRYLRGRSFEREKELPIYKVENQTYIHYGKGSVVLYALQDYIGEDSVNLAMRQFLDEYKYVAPYPTSENFLAYLEPKIPDSLSYIMNDWFRTITLYDNRITEANYQELDNGKVEVTMKLTTKKLLADSIGEESDLPLRDYIDIGLFADGDEEDLMYVNRVLMTEPETTIVVTVDSIPRKAAIDPKHLLIDRVFDDNVKTVKEL
jgi:aminopeptidase N